MAVTTLTIENLHVRYRVATGGGSNTFIDGEVTPAVSMLGANAVRFEILAFTKLNTTSSVDVLLQESNDGWNWHTIPMTQTQFTAAGPLPLQMNIGMAFVRAMFLVRDSSAPGATTGVSLDCVLTTSLQ